METSLKRRNRIIRAGRGVWAVALTLAAVGGVSLQGQGRANGDHWVGSWGTAVQAPLVIQLPPGATPPAPAGQPPAPAPVNSLNNQTLRQIVRTSIGGAQARVTFTNVYSTEPLVIGAAHLAVRDKDANIVAGSGKPVTFGGRPSMIIPPRATILSDPVAVNIPALGDVAIDVFFPGDTAAGNSPQTLHVGAWQTNYVSTPGNHAGAATFPVQTTTASYFFTSRLDVIAPAQTAAIVTFGDSITDGTNSTPDTNNRWPNHLAKRILSQSNGPQFGVVNSGISGNRVLSDGMGVSALQRFERDALDQAGVTHVVVLEGINDVGMSSITIGGLPKRDPAPTAEDIIQGHQQLIERAHMRGIKIIGATLTPYEGALYFAPEGEKVRQAINQWLRTSNAYDGLIDFDNAVKDPANPTKILPKYDSGDHLHPSDLGYQMMAEAVNLELFKSGATTARPTAVTK
jgi:lysophospholipase L1-like esterase